MIRRPRDVKKDDWDELMRRTAGWRLIKTKRILWWRDCIFEKPNHDWAIESVCCLVGK